MDPGGPVRREIGNLSKLKESLVLMAGSNKLTTAPVSLLSNPDCIQVILMITAGSSTIIVFEQRCVSRTKSDLVRSAPFYGNLTATVHTSCQHVLSEFSSGVHASEATVHINMCLSGAMLQHNTVKQI